MTPDITGLAVGGIRTLRELSKRIPFGGGILAESLHDAVKGKTIIAMDTDPETLNWIQKGVIAATISQKPYTMAFVGLKMIDDLHHSGVKNFNSDWAHDSFAPVPAFVDTGSALVDKSNVDAFITATKSFSGQ